MHSQSSRPTHQYSSPPPIAVMPQTPTKRNKPVERPAANRHPPQPTTQSPHHTPTTHTPPSHTPPIIHDHYHPIHTNPNQFEVPLDFAYTLSPITHSNTNTPTKILDDTIIHPTPHTYTQHNIFE